MAPPRTRPARPLSPAIFPRAIAERNRILAESYLGGEIQFECSAKRRVQTPYAMCPRSSTLVRPEMIPRRPRVRATPRRLRPFPFIARVAILAAQRMHTKCKATRATAKIWRRIFDARIRANGRSVTIGSPSRRSQDAACFTPDRPTRDTAPMSRLYARRSRNDETVSA